MNNYIPLLQMMTMMIRTTIRRNICFGGLIINIIISWSKLEEGRRDTVEVVLRQSVELVAVTQQNKRMKMNRILSNT